MSKKAFIPTEFHTRIFSWVDNGGPGDNGLIEAVAGSGKTSTLEQIAHRIPSRFRILMLAFGKNIAQALQERMPSHCLCMTLNSLGNRAWTDYARSAKNVTPTIDGRKTYRLMRSLLTYEDSKNIGSQVAKLVSIAKAYGIVPAGAGHLKGLEPDTNETWEKLVKKFDLDFPQAGSMARAIQYTRDVLKLSIKESWTYIDYDDQLYLPVIVNVPISQFPWVAVDEAQDLSPIQLALIERVIHPEGRALFVGDEKQAIYGFRGADSESIQKIKEKFKCTVLPLSITYRCPKNVVALVKPIVPHILAHPDAPEGTVAYPKTFRHTDFQPDDMVLCRTTAPLVTLAYRLISQGTPCAVLGRDIGQGLISIIEKLGVSEIDGDKGLLSHLKKWEEREITRHMSNDEPGKVQSAQDKADTIRMILEAKSEIVTSQELVAEINRMFASDEREAKILTLSTIHKAKGLEAKVVWVLDYNMMPMRWAKQDWQIQQEMNLIYVAYTRAMDTLNLVVSDGMVDGSGKPFPSKKRSKKPLELPEGIDSKDVSANILQKMGRRDAKKAAKAGLVESDVLDF